MLNEAVFRTVLAGFDPVVRAVGEVIDESLAEEVREHGPLVAVGAGLRRLDGPVVRSVGVRAGGEGERERPRSAVDPFERGAALRVVLEVEIGVLGDLGVGGGERVDRVGEHQLVGFGADGELQPVGEPVGVFGFVVAVVVNRGVLPGAPVGYLDPNPLQVAFAAERIGRRVVLVEGTAHRFPAPAVDLATQKGGGASVLGVERVAERFGRRIAPRSPTPLDLLDPLVPDVAGHFGDFTPGGGHAREQPLGRGRLVEVVEGPLATARLGEDEAIVCHVMLERRRGAVSRHIIAVDQVEPERRIEPADHDDRPVRFLDQVGPRLHDPVHPVAEVGRGGELVAVGAAMSPGGTETGTDQVGDGNLNFAVDEANRFVGTLVATFAAILFGRAAGILARAATGATAWPATRSATTAAAVGAGERAKVGAFHRPTASPSDASASGSAVTPATSVGSTGNGRRNFGPVRGRTRGGEQRLELGLRIRRREFRVALQSRPAEAEPLGVPKFVAGAASEQIRPFELGAGPVLFEAEPSLGPQPFG